MDHIGIDAHKRESRICISRMGANWSSGGSAPRPRRHSYTIAMRVVDEPEIAAWLEALEGISQDFDWDAGNRTKNRKHRVDTADVEALLDQPVLLAGRIVQPEQDEPRWLLLGRDDNGRRLALVFTRRGDLLRPITLSPDAANREASL